MFLKMQKGGGTEETGEREATAAFIVPSENPCDPRIPSDLFDYLAESIFEIITLSLRHQC